MTMVDALEETTSGRVADGMFKLVVTAERKTKGTPRPEATTRYEVDGSAKQENVVIQEAEGMSVLETMVAVRSKVHLSLS